MSKGMINIKNKKNIYAITSVFLLFFLFYFFGAGDKINVQNEEQADYSYEEDIANTQKEEDVSLPKNKITGQRCENGDKRPFAVMLAADKVARPLSGISEADIVFEMPVITDGITRYMAGFVCSEPKEIGSIRSSRPDFITLADSIDAIYVHWGGSKDALDILDRGVIDNINALTNPYNAFFRKSTARPPHNGFTNFERLKNASEKLGYRENTNFEGYPHTEDKSKTRQKYEVVINYPKPYNVRFRYDPNNNSYFRLVNDFKEIDKNTNKQVVVKNLVIMRAESKQISADYNDVKIETFGKATVYRNGEMIRGRWEKKGKKYIFLDNKNREIEFTPGKIWISIVQPNQTISIKNL